MFRFLDLVFSLAALMIFIMPMAMLSLFILMDDGMPIFFSQERVGALGKRFRIYKFRTMRHDPARSIGAVSGDSPEDLLVARKKFETTGVGDPRITLVGRYLRKAHLDELPQLWNVVLGDMSMVGVRPDTPSQELDYKYEYWKLRHRYKPGITGFAQIESDVVDLDGRSALELRWINDRTVYSYFLVICKTVMKVFRGSSF